MSCLLTPYITRHRHICQQLEFLLSLSAKVGYLSKKKKHLVANQHRQEMTRDKTQNVIKRSHRKMNAGNYTQYSDLGGGV